MVWKQATQEFKLRLKNNTPVASSNLVFFKFQKTKDAPFVIKGNNFLASLEELKELFNIEEEKLLEDILNTAIKLLQSSANQATDYAQLTRLMNSVKANIKDRVNLRSDSAGGYDCLANVFCGIVGSWVMALSSLSTYQAVLVISAATAATLSVNTWLWLGLSVIGIMLSFSIICASLHNVYTNYRYAQESQLKELTDFVALLNPESMGDAVYRYDDESVMQGFENFKPR